MHYSVTKHCHFLILALMLLWGCDTPLGNTPPKNHGNMDSLMQQVHINYTDSSRYFNLVDSIYQSIPNPDNYDRWYRYYYGMGYFYFYKKDFNRALVYTDSLLQVGGENDGDVQNMALYAKTMFTRGDIYFGRARYDDAFECYYRARQQILKTGDSCAFATYSTTLARVSYHQKKYLDAAHYHILALAETQACNQPSFEAFKNQQGALDNIALCYSRQGMEDSAEYYFNAALHYIVENEGRFPGQRDFIATAKAVIWGNQAEAAILKGDDTLAERLLLQSINVNRLPQNAPEDAVYSRIKLVKIYFKQGKLQMAGNVLADCAVALDTISNNELSLELSRLQSQYAAASHDTAGAFIYLTKYNHKKDSLANLTIPITSADIQASFENLERKNELLVLQEKSRVQAIYIFALVMAAGMAAAIILLAWKNSRQSKKHIRALSQTLKALEKSQQDNSRLISVVAHDLRNPVGAMTNFAKLTLDETPDGTPLHKILGLMYRSGTSALDLIGDLLHIQTSSAPLAGEELDLQELLQYCVNILQYKASEKQQVIILYPVAAIISGDREKLWRVFSNLITNAIKFSMPQASIIIRMKVEKANVVVSVEDKGIGIPADIQNVIFDLSGKAKRKGTAGEPSFGLGLVISKQIIELHKGKIWFTSTTGLGTTFYVELPQG